MSNKIIQVKKAEPRNVNYAGRFLKYSASREKGGERVYRMDANVISSFPQLPYSYSAHL